MGDISCGCLTCVSTSTLGIVETLGKFDYVAEPGLNCINCCTQSMAGRVSLRITPLVVDCPTKTQDNVVVTIRIVVQFRVLPQRVEDAYYKMSNPSGQISSYVTNVVRGIVPTHTLDETYLLRDELQEELRKELANHLENYGFQIVAALICDVVPAENVKAAMNQINTNARLKVATMHKSEAEKYEVVKAAEADAEAKRLSGVGLAEQRKAAVNGLQSSVQNFQTGVQSMTAKNIMDLLLLNQYTDVLKEISENGKTTTVFMPGSDTKVAEGMIAGQSGLTRRM